MWNGCGTGMDGWALWVRKTRIWGSRANSSIGSRYDAQANEKVTILLEISEWRSAMLL